MANSTGNFSLTSNFNPTFDITWSFQYSVTGISSSTGGFCTFLYNSPTLTSGGILSGLGYMPYNGVGGVNGNVLGVVFRDDNKILIKKGTTFDTLSTFTLFESLSPLIKETQEYNTIRFNLTDVGQTLKIAVKDADDIYVDLASINTGLFASEKDYYKVGFSYATPSISGTDKIALSLKDFHVHGQTRTPSSEISIKPYVVPKEETYYILQTPSSGHIDIGDPDFTGSLVRSRN